jgi:hypothetical protein
MNKVLILVEGFGLQVSACHEPAVKWHRAGASRLMEAVKVGQHKVAFVLDSNAQWKAFPGFH